MTEIAQCEIGDGVMDSYDSVWVHCPNCSAILELKSKAGSCEMNSYSTDSVPKEIAKDIEYKTARCKCGARVGLAIREESRVQMTVFAKRKKPSPSIDEENRFQAGGSGGTNGGRVEPPAVAVKSHDET